MKRFIPLLYIFLSIVVLPVGAQTLLKQEGVVLDAQTKEPLPGVSILLAGTTTGVSTDERGLFQIAHIPAHGELHIRCVGYMDQVLPAKSERLIIELQPRVEDLQTITVTANREAALRTETPVAISKLSPRLIEETKPVSLHEVINKTAGVLMVNLGNEQHSMAIRQPMTTSAYFLYMEDGVPIRPMGVFNHNALLELNQFSISSVEVVKGPVSSIYGPEAVGGAINFITQRPTAMLTARIGIQADQWGFQRVQFGAGSMIGKFGIYAGGFTSRQRNSWMTRSDYDKTALNLRTEYHFTPRTRLISTISYGDYNSQTSGNVDSVAFYARQYTSTTDFTYRKVYSLRGRVTLEHEWAEGSSSYLTGFIRDNKNGQNPAYGIRWVTGQTTARGEINSNDFTSYGMVAQHTQRLGFLNSRLISGASFDLSPNTYQSYQVDLIAQLRADKKSVEKYTLDRERPDIQIANYKATIYNTAAYMQYEAEPITNLRVSAGIRYDRMAFDYTNFLDQTAGQKQYSQFTPKLGATYDLGAGAGLYTNYSRGFSPPGLTTIFRKRTTTATDAELFNYQLEPARFNNTELGGWASLAGNKLYLDWALYQMRGTNELLNIRQPDNSTDYQSAGKTLHRGIELSLTYKPTQEWYLRAGGTYATHRFIDFTLSQKATDLVKDVNGLDMPSSPNWVWNMEASYYPQWLKNLRTSLEWQHVTGWYQNQTNTVRYEGYDLVNFRTGYQWKGIELFTNVLNLMNTLYATNATRGNSPTDRTTYSPAAPRTFVFGIQYQFNSK